MFDDTPTTTGQDAGARWARPLPPAEARAEVSVTIERYLSDAVTWHADGAAGVPPILALAVTAGTGKTQSTLKHLGHIAPSLLPHGSAVYYAPTLELAREACAIFRELAPDVPASVVAGRSAIVDGAPLCRRADEIKGLGAMVPSIQEAVCKRHDRGRMIVADCYQGCRYQQQFDHGRTEIVFTSHAYLRWQLPVQGTVSLRIIDEAFWPTMHGSSILLADAWLNGPTRKQFTERMQDEWVQAQAKRAGAAARRFWETPGPLAADYHPRIGEARLLVVEALREGRSPIAALRGAGIDREFVEAFADWEVHDLPVAAVSLEQDPGLQSEIIQAFDPAERKAMLLRAKVWQLIAADYEAGDTGRLSWVALKPCPETGQPRHAIGLHLRHDLPLDAPILMIDADLDPLIIGAYTPSASFVRIDAEQTAEIVQVSDRTMSTTWLLDPENGRTRRDLVRAVIAEEVAAADGGQVLLVATKAVLRALHSDVDPGDDLGADSALRRPIAGAHPAWFGPSMRGVNRYSRWSRMVVVGRHEPPLSEVLATTRSIFGVAPPSDAMERRHSLTVGYTMADGSAQVAEIAGLPYFEGQAVLKQVREALTNQAIARLRLVAPAEPKHVLLLCKIPIAPLPISSLLYWDELACPRLRRAIHAAPEIEPGVRRLRISARGLHEDAPEVFETFDAAKAWRRGRTTESVLSAASRIAAGFGMSTSFRQVNGARGGKAVPALLFFAADDLRAEKEILLSPTPSGQSLR